MLVTSKIATPSTNSVVITCELAVCPNWSVITLDIVVNRAAIFTLTSPVPPVITKVAARLPCPADEEMHVQPVRATRLLAVAVKVLAFATAEELANVTAVLA